MTGWGLACFVPVLVALLMGLNVGESVQRVAGPNSGIRFGNTAGGNTALVRSSATVVDGCGQFVLFVALFVAYVVDGWPVLLGMAKAPSGVLGAFGAAVATTSLLPFYH